MHILLLSATELEIKPTLDFHQSAALDINAHRMDVLVGGVGMLSTSYALMKWISQHRPSYIIQAGFAGSFDQRYAPGSLVIVNEEMVGDCGVSENGQFNDIFDLQLAGADEFPFRQKVLVNPHWHEWKQYGLPFVKGVTVNKITTGTENIESIVSKYNPSVESMEGAALHYVCLKENIPFIQLRAISNFVGERNKANWKIRESIELLNNSLIQLIRQLP